MKNCNNKIKKSKKIYKRYRDKKSLNNIKYNKLKKNMKKR